MKRHGLTLLELVIVLTILVALAGLVVPMISNLWPFSSTAVGATNAAATEAVVQLYLSRPQSNTLDLLDNIATSSGLLSYVPNIATAGGTTTTATADIAPYQLTSPALTSLNSLGIAHVHQLIENPNPTTPTVPAWNPTFFPYAYDSATGLPTVTTLTAGATVASLSNLAAAQKFGVSSTGTNVYVVFGLGKYSTMSGMGGGSRYLQEAPVAYSPNANSGPDTVYCRFGLVFQVDPINGAPAMFIGAVEFEPNGAMARDDNLILNGQTQ
jgi:prepilin-type N-terminal cleavage/methylation domain-containing protein